jgi:DNA polymerase III subunit delta
MQDFQKIMLDLKSKVYHPIYFLMGEEPYFIDRVSNYIEQNVLDENEKEFNQSVLYGGDVDVLRIISEAKRFPMMSNHSVVIVKEAQNIKGLVGKDDSDEDDTTESKDKKKSPLLTYLENPQKSTLLVFCYKYKTIDKRTSLAKLLQKRAVTLVSDKLYENKIPDWVVGYLKTHQYTITPRASVLLTENLGNNLSKIANELDKIMLNLPPKSEITETHIQTYVGISKDFNVFELQTALGKRDVLKANRIINYFAANPKDNPLVLVLPNLFGYFNKILIYHCLSDKSAKNVAAELRVHPFFVGDYERAAKIYNLSKIVAIISDLREYDLKSKGFDNSSASDGELMKELIYKILH